MSRLEELTKELVDKGVAEDDAKAFLEKLMDEVSDAIMHCDPSEKMVPHEPYNTIMNQVDAWFQGEEEDDG